MEHASLWTVDRLAASQLLAELKLEATEERLEQAARLFARHRRDLMSWAAERVQENMTQALEAVSTQSFARESEDWTRGFCYAEQQILTMAPDELLDLGSERPRTTGQFLRSMLRQARAQSI